MRRTLIITLIGAITFYLLFLWMGADKDAAIFGVVCSTGTGLLMALSDGLLEYVNRRNM